MINAFQTIGRVILKKDGYYEATDDVLKREKLLFHQTIIPKEKENKQGNKILDGRALCLNFDLEKNEIEFRLSDKELTEENRSYFFAFKLGAPKDKKKFLTTNNFSTLLTNTFSDSQEYLRDKRKNNKAKKWINTNISDDYEIFMNTILNRFYLIEGKEIYLNYDLLKEEQKKLFYQIKDQYSNKKKSELYVRYLNKQFFNTDSKDISNFPTITMALFNGQRILDYESGKYKNDYINLCYYDLLNRFVVEKGIEKKLCHICKKEKTVIQDLPFPMKFYGSTNALNFEYLKNKNAYRSFAICEDCLPEIITGMKYIQNNLSEYLFDLNLYMIPTGMDENNFDIKLYKQIIKILKTNKSVYKNEIEQIKQLLRRSARKNVQFNLMFYYHPAGSQQFDVLKLISNIDLNKLLPKLELMDEMNKNYELNFLGDENALTINSLRYSLFPSNLSHKNLSDKKQNYKVFAKDLLNFLESFLKDSKLNYSSLINNFIIIYKKRFNQNRTDKLAAFKLNLFLTILYRLNLLKGGNSVNEGQFISDILKKEYQEFFDVHSAVYADSAYRQGLFLLGTVIAKIIYLQKDKSSSFLKKLNFDGIAARRVPALVNQVKQFEDIYRKKIFQEKGIWGNIMDRLQGIENSALKPDEVVFYILSGISFDDYLGMKKAMEKNLNQTEGE